MSCNIKLTRDANRDLEEIYVYIAFALQSEQNAIGQLDRLERGIASLESMPERFRVFEREPWAGRGLRIMPVDNHIVFCIPNSETETVTVIRIMYGGRDTEKQLWFNS